MNLILTTIIFVSVLVIVIGFIGYTITTNSIIKSQEQEISELRRALTHYERSTPIEDKQKKSDIKFGGF
jgi:type II secretory pathway component PulJ